MFWMRKAAPFAFLCCAATALGGFEMAPYNMRAVSTARANWQKAQTACRTRTDLKTLVEAMNCFFGADRDFSLSIHLRDAKILTAYTAGEKSIAADLTAGKIDNPEAAKRFHAAEDGFFQAIVDAGRDYETRSAQDYINSLDSARHGTMGNDMNTMGSMNDGMMH